MAKIKTADDLFHFKNNLYVWASGFLAFKSFYGEIPVAAKTGKQKILTEALTSTKNGEKTQ